MMIMIRKALFTSWNSFVQWRSYRDQRMIDASARLLARFFVFQVKFDSFVERSKDTRLTDTSHETDWTQTSHDKWWCQQLHCCALSTDKPQHWLGLCSLLNLQYKLCSTTDQRSHNTNNWCYFYNIHARISMWSCFSVNNITASCSRATSHEMFNDDLDVSSIYRDIVYFT